MNKKSDEENKDLKKTEVRKHNELLLTSVYQNVQTAMQSINNILPSIESDALANELSKQESEYNVISKECEIIAKSEGIDIKENNMFEKIRLWSSIKLSTLTDKTTSHVTELLLIGTFMGVINCIKSENDYSYADKNFIELSNKLKNFEEANIESLKMFL